MILQPTGRLDPRTSGIGRALMRGIRRSDGVTAIEMAYLLPVMLVAVLMFCEIARMGAIVVVANYALDQAVLQYRPDNSAPDEETMASDIKAELAEDSLGYLTQADLAVQVSAYATLTAMGGGTDDEDDDEDESETSSAEHPPAYGITLTVTKPYLTPLPELLTLGRSFRYERVQILGTLIPDDDDDDDEDDDD